jgi:hypothetical protein
MVVNSGWGFTCKRLFATSKYSPGIRGERLRKIMKTCIQGNELAARNLEFLQKTNISKTTYCCGVIYDMIYDVM